MKPKFGFLPTLVATLFIIATACTVNNQSTSSDNKISIRISQIAASTAGTTISWIDDKGDNMGYTIKVYTNADCTNLHEEYALTFGAMEEKRFSVPYLSSDRLYYIVVENTATGYKSNPFEVELSASHIRSEVVSQNFDQLFWGYDYINSANGVKLNDDIVIKRYNVEKLADAIEDSVPTTSIDEYGGPLFTYTTHMRKLMGFEGWPTSDEVYIMPGYIRLGSAKGIGVLRTPNFSALEDKTAKINISFSAAIFSNTLQANGGKIELVILKGDGATLASKSFNLKGVSGKPEWNHFSTSVEGVTADCHCEIRTNSNTKQTCIDNLKIVRHLDIPEGYIYGYTYDKATGKPISNVAVSDGFSVVTTDNEGLYMMKPSSDTWYIYYSVPANCEVVRFIHGPKFYTRYSKDVKEYSFELKLLPDGKPEEKFALLTFADPQVSSSTGLNRFTKEAIPAIKAYAKELSAEMPVYGITLGDVISTSTSDADLETTRGDATQYMEKMREAMRPSSVGFPIFQVMGNHDCNYFGRPNPLIPDETSSTTQLKAQREFESTFGPINYSFNRGDIHIIGMRDIWYKNDYSTRDYATGFTQVQYEWLKQDLAVVPKDKMVVLCVHIPLFGSASKSGESGHYVKEVHQLLNEFKEAHIISGHTHYQRNYEHTTYKIFEHNMGTVCGTWWSSNICGDGTPNGYGVFIGEGNTFTNWYYMGYHEGMNKPENQLRLHRGNAITGAKRQPNAKDPNGTGYYSYNFADDVILANVYNADSKWVIKVYEDGIHTGNMEKVAINMSGTIVGDYTYANPRRADEGVEICVDWYTAAFYYNYYEGRSAWSECYHLYKYQLKNKDAQIRVEATDGYGNVFTETKITEGTDYSLVAR